MAAITTPVAYSSRCLIRQLHGLTMFCVASDRSRGVTSNVPSALRWFGSACVVTDDERYARVLALDMKNSGLVVNDRPLDDEATRDSRNSGRMAEVNFLGVDMERFVFDAEMLEDGARAILRGIRGQVLELRSEQQTGQRQ